MRKKAGAEITKAVKKRYNQIVAFSNFEELLNRLRQTGSNGRKSERILLT